jgi:hypothetical protein
MQTSARTYLEALYLSWVNEYLTIDTFAEHHGLTYKQASDLIDLMQSVYNTKHPEE